MTELEQSAFFAALEAEIAALDHAAPPNCIWLLEELEAIGNSRLDDATRPNFVADGVSAHAGNALGNKVASEQDALSLQYADTHASQLISSAIETRAHDEEVPKQVNRHSRQGKADGPVWRIAADRSSGVDVAPCA